ncbi:hypothetical protein ACFXDJ_09970 [Streptomyces sp. NPDC059443]|uniref:hypothetical protein n=1 Tax=unclassified Streptomyces TaxID=2593676 RepID=UPI0036C2973E
MTPRRANERLAGLLAEAGWNGAELARGVNALGTLHGLALRYDRTAVAHWLSGTRPRRPVPELIAAALTDRCGRFVTVEEAGFDPGPEPGPGPGPDSATDTGPDTGPGSGPAAGPGSGAGPTAEGLRRLTLQTRADADPHTRPPLFRSPYQPVPIEAWEADQAEAGGPAAPEGPGPGPGPGTGTGPGMAELAARRHLAAHAEQLRALAGSFSGLYLAHGGTHTRAALAAWLAQDAGAFAARRPRPGPPGAARGAGPGGVLARARISVGRAAAVVEDDVLRGYAQLTHLLGDMTVDAGYHGLAQEYHAIALGLARQAGDRRLYAITLRAMSAHAGRLGQPGYAVRLARMAVDAAPADGEPGTLAFLLVQRAAAHAHAGERAAAAADLAAADRVHARHAAKAPAGPFDSYARPDFDFARARTHLALGEFPDAVEALERSLRGRAAGQHRATALTHAALAETLLRLGHLTRACEHWRAFLTAAPAVRSRAVREALGRLLRDLTPYRRTREAVPTVAMARALAERL